MSVSAVSNIATQFQPSTARKVDAESKVEGKKPDGDNDADDKVAATQSAATASVPPVAGGIGQNINIVV